MSFSSEPENPWSYVFLSFFRNNPAAIARDLKKRGRSELSWGNIALASFANTLFVMFLFNWGYVIFFFLPFSYLGHCFSYLNGYFRHYGADPDNPIAGASAATEGFTTGSFFIMATMPSITSARRCIGQRWKPFISKSRSCRNGKARA
jgi:hypothetical protein